MRKKGFVAVTTAAAAMVVLAGSLMASNMSFKLNYPLKKAAVGVSKTGNQTIGLPYYPQVGMLNVSHLFKDISQAGSVQNISKFLPATDTYQIYTFGAPDFVLQSGVGYVVKAGSDFGYIIVGSHNPGDGSVLGPFPATIPLKKACIVGTAPGACDSKTGTNLFTPPYHACAATAKDLFQEIAVAQNIGKFLRATDTFQIYSFGAPDFALEPGAAYFIKMGADLDYLPCHY